MDINDLRSFLTVLMFMLFIGIIGWAYSSKRKQAFEAAARLDDDEDRVISRPDSADKQYN